jgi:phosphoribosylamine--glycine ligase
VFTAGGRVLCAVGLGEHISDARREAYDLVHAIHWEGAQYRRDIGDRALAQAPP